MLVLVACVINGEPMSSLVEMTQEAIRCYRLLNELSVELGITDEHTWAERASYLQLLVGDFSTSEDTVVDGPQGLDERSRGVREADALQAHREMLCGVAEPGTIIPDWIQFIPSGSIGHLRRWHFIKGDPDPHPSVPHGHDGGRTFPKLDPFLGWIHNSTTKLGGRLSRNDTRSLWNDGRFRDFASAALIHFAQENPQYLWRVPVPTRIPRRRK